MRPETVRSLWLDEAPPLDAGDAPPLRGETRADVCIAGGGYPGLWTAEAVGDDAEADGAISSLAMPIHIVSAPVTLDELRRMAADQFGDFVKAVVDVQHGVMAIGGELHADEEALLLEQGARQADLWGINLYPDRPGAEQVEFDSMINVRPSQGNRSRGVEGADMRRRIHDIVARLVVP